jgi:ribosomal protein L2
MDRKIEAPAWHKRAKLAAAAGGSVLLLIAVAVFIAMPGGKMVKVESNTVAVGEVTVGSHALRAGRENPIRALRYE